MNYIKKFIYIFLLLITSIITTFSQTFLVGPNQTYSKPSDIVDTAIDGDTILIEAAEYLGDTVAWWQSNLVIEGLPNGENLPHIKGNGATTNDRGLWIFYGNNVTVRNIKFSKAISQEYHDGAGIVFGGQDMKVDSCIFLDNQRGITVDWNIDSDVRISHCEFAYNHSTEQVRNPHILVGRVRSFELTFSYLHHTDRGSHVFSQATKNQILYNRIMDEATGSGLFLLNFESGGEVYVVGNTLMHGSNAMYHEMIAYGIGGLTYPNNFFYCYNNTIVKNAVAAPFIWMGQSVASTKIFNNMFIGNDPLLLGGKGVLIKNRQTELTTANFMDSDNYDYHLTEDSPGIDKAIAPEKMDVGILPNMEYVHPRKAKMRLTNNSLDIGAFEFN